MELMVSMTLGLVIIVAALIVYASSSTGTRLSESESRLNEDGLIALSVISQQIKLAGYSSAIATATSTYTVKTNLGGAGIRGCTGGFTANTATFNVLACSGDVTLSDAFAVRYEADRFNTVPTANSPTNCLGNGISAFTIPDASNTFPAYALADNRFYIRTSGTSSGSPELTCTGANNTSSFDIQQPLLENVEFMSLRYGVSSTTNATDTQVVAYMSAADIDTQYAAEAADLRWKRVLSVRVCLLMRGDAKASDQDTAPYIDCDNVKQTSADKLLRRAFTTTISMRNRSALPSCVGGGSTC